MTGGDKALQTYLQCMVGYMLTGSTREQCIFFLYGDGSNGKSTFLEILAELLGTYAMNAQSDTITARRSSDGPRTDIARLKGARLVTISECPADVWLMKPSSSSLPAATWSRLATSTAASSNSGPSSS